MAAPWSMRSMLIRSILAAGRQPRGGLGYGGGEFHTRGSLIVFVDKDSRLYRTTTQQNDICRPITPGFGSSSSPAISPDGQFVLFLHSDGRDNSIGLVDLTEPAWPTRLVYGADFYMQPAWHPDGKTIAWVEWNAPCMSWDGSQVKTAHFDPVTKTISNIETIAGGNTTPVFQPEFSPDGRFISYIQGAGDTDDLILFDLASGDKIVVLHNEILIQPAWLMGQRVYGWSADSASLFVIRQRSGMADILEVEIARTNSKDIPIPDIPRSHRSAFRQPAMPLPVSLLPRSSHPGSLNGKMGRSAISDAVLKLIFHLRRSRYLNR